MSSYDIFKNGISELRPTVFLDFSRKETEVSYSEIPNNLEVIS